MEKSLLFFITGATLSLRFPESNIYPNDRGVSMILFWSEQNFTQKSKWTEGRTFKFKVSGGSNTKNYEKQSPNLQFFVNIKRCKIKKKEMSETYSTIIER
jgi:hypothetical protein